MRITYYSKRVWPVFAGVFFGACVVNTGDDTRASDTLATPVATAPMPSTPAFPASDMRIEVDITARQLHVYRGNARVETHSVAVGSSQWPTQTGSWTIGQVAWNPEWVPPDEEWAKDEKRAAPGASDNPLGRAQLIYDAPRSIHGTNNPSSIGQAVSHGSIRVTNEVATKLARDVMEAGGATRDEAFYTRVRDNRTQNEVVDLPNPIPIRVF